jgi:peptidyl-dipeptidase A
MTPLDMVKAGERFYTSLGFEPLPNLLRTLALRPAEDRDVVCHASAWDIIDLEADIRIKMCIDQTAEDFSTIHHELGHNFYQQATKRSRCCFATAPTTAFTKPSATRWRCLSRRVPRQDWPARQAPDASRDIGLLMDRALEKVAFCPSAC